ncbi:MAG: PH domain-containing protein [Candidatus Micrarchaeota archaeon]|nr:PH domain-containing protein [Candidatus Micrarchaeota archaeon]
MPVYEDHSQATCYVIPLSRKKLIKKTLEGLVRISLGIIVVSLLATMWSAMGYLGYAQAISSLVMLALMIVIALALVSSAFLVAYNYVYIKNYYYDIRPSEIVIRKGVLMKKELSLAYEKVQEVYIDQDLLDKLLGIYDVHVKTAAEHSEDFAHIDGLDGDGAQKIKGMIIANIRNKIAGA